jgi:hypothetical protein
MPVVDSSITTTTAAGFIPQLWSDGVIDAVEFSAVIQKRVNRSFEKELTVGNTLNVPRLSNLTTQTKASGVSNTINFEAITETDQVITVSTHEYAAFLLEQVVNVQANQDLRSQYEKKIGYAITRGREVTLANLFTTFTANALIGALGVELTADDYLSGWTAMANAGLLEMSPDPGEEFSIFLDPAAYAAALKVDVFTNSLYNKSGDAIQRATMGDIYGFPVFVSNLLRSPAALQHDCFLMHKEAIALIVQEEVPVTSQYLIRNLADGVVGWNLYGQTKVSFPPETPGGGTAVDNRGQRLATV